MIDVSNVSDYNLFFVSQYSSRAFLVAGRFFDLTEDWERLSCEWYSLHGFKELANDRYIGQINGRDAIRYRSVDELVNQNPKELSAIGQHLFEQWQGIKANLAKHRNTDPVVIIAPPVEPPPLPKPIELPPPSPAPKKQRPEWLIKASVWLVVATPVVMGVSLFLPPPWNVLAKLVLEFLKQLAGG